MLSLPPTVPAPQLNVIGIAALAMSVHELVN
jgi:hypothetical protein